MNVTVRLSAPLAQSAGQARLSVSIPESACLADLIEELRQSYPQLNPQLSSVVAVISGRHISPTEILQAGQEVALLVPVAGG